MIPDDITRALDELEALYLNLGRPLEDEPEGYAVELNNGILADPYLFGTGGFLPSREDAETLAALTLPMLDALAVAALIADPDLGLGWTHPEQVAQESYATIVSAAREPYGQDPRGGDPVYEETYHGDVWLVAGAAVPFTLRDDELERLERVRELVVAARA